MQPNGLDDAHRWLEDYTRRVTETQRRTEQVQEQLRNARATATSPDGAVSVVLAPGGRLESLKLTPQAMQLGHERLSATITQTIRSAHEDAAAQTQEALLPLVGESDAMDFLRDQINTAMADDPALAEDDSAERPDGARNHHEDEGDDDDYFNGGSYLR